MYFKDLSQLEERNVIPGFKGKFVHSEYMTLAYWDTEKDAILPLHSHSHEEVANVLEGKMEMTIEGETVILEPGMVAVIPPNVKHSGRAITDCKVLDIFHPTREEYK